MTWSLLTPSYASRLIVTMALFWFGALVGFTSVASAAAAIAVAPPTISGEARVLSELTCSSGSWDQPVTLAFQWMLDDTAIAGATGATYTVPVASRGRRVACRVTATASDATTAVASSLAVVPTRAVQKISGNLLNDASVARACGASIARACAMRRSTVASVVTGGTLAPARTGAKVVVLYERQRGRTWVLSMSRTATVSAAGTYSVAIPNRYFAATNWRVRTRVPETDVYEMASSPMRFLHVVF